MRMRRMTAPTSNIADFFDIVRLRIETDGQGVRSLVCFSGCPLKCKYCPNKKKMKNSPLSLSPASLLDSLKIDDIYFRASSIGGITLGGGEPALHSEFIEEFRKLCLPEWTLFIETSLNVPLEHVERLSKVIDYWFIDIKDMNETIYRKYTGISNGQVLKNLQYLIEQGLGDKITVRVPLIPGYNTEDDVEKSITMLQKMGVMNEQLFTYELDFAPDDPPMGIPAPDPPRYQNYLYYLAIILAIGAGILSTLWLPSKVISTLGGIFIGLIVAVVLCIIIAYIPWQKLGDSFEDTISKLYDKVNDGRD